MRFTMITEEGTEVISPMEFIPLLEETGLIILDRVLHTSTDYPASYGFIPRTYGDDFDPLDVLVLCAQPLHPLTLVRCYPIGVIQMLDNGRRDEKIIAVPFQDPNYNDYKSIFSLPRHIYDEMRHFFSVYKQLEGKQTAVEEIGDREEALTIISRCIESYNAKFGNKK